MIQNLSKVSLTAFCVSARFSRIVRSLAWDILGPRYLTLNRTRDFDIPAGLAAECLRVLLELRRFLRPVVLALMIALVLRRCIFSPVYLQARARFFWSSLEPPA